MRIGITGASGMLGTALLRKLSLDPENSVLATSRTKGLLGSNINWNCFDLTDQYRLNDWLEIYQPDAIVHCAAMVNVDMCEDYPLKAQELHVTSTETISEFFDKTGGRLIYISTDSLYNGNGIKPHKETDDPKPENHYSKSKFLGEASVNQIKNGVIIRTSILGKSSSKQKSFFEWVLSNLVQKTSMNLFVDVLFSPIHVSHLSEVIDIFLSNSHNGTFNCGSQDYLSKYEFGIKVADIFNLPCDTMLKSTLEQANLKAKRPRNMALCNDKLEKLIEYKLPKINEVIELLYQEYKNSIKH